MLKILVALSIVGLSCQPQGDKVSGTGVTKTTKAKVEVYDFHTTYRCATCLAIEENARQTLTQYFSDALADGSVDFQVVNVDLPENAELAEHFQAFGTSLFLKINEEGQSEIMNLSEFAFMNAGDAEIFRQELKRRIEKYL